MPERRHRLNSLEVAPVRHSVRSQLVELLENHSERDRLNAEILFRVWWRLEHCRPGAPNYPPFSWATLRAFIQPERMVPLGVRI